MKIVVIGGTGLIGSQVVATLGERGHEAVPAAPSTGVDTLTGKGLSEVMSGADVVVDVSNSPSFADDDVLEFFRRSTTNLVRAARDAGTGHYVALSVVGAEGLPDSGYLRAKVAQEQLIREAAVPFSLVRATQFFEFAAGIADSATTEGAVHLPAATVQPIAAADVAEAVASAAVDDPSGGSADIAGPEPLPMDEWIRTVLTAKSDPRPVITDPQARYYGTRLGEQSLVPAGEADRGKTRLAQWLAG
ncbi:SDR family oxidoreductase [Amycolatopsis jiangsuensis]|uniref:Uncharacterized protein YbjT (DUF2867 family) n=1 Tax=Amycolatopsis jiangsuensis TaxID=1181879 RepID=A0A840IUL2_9PSEU|nr:SDR family oxidoreductase [Amycolatopsis jiangsuensis]MBB4685037.1 uncharacterized protein YbjT (DUF2867 family) [Amycolatopsis jiangsuensis]